MLTSTILKKLKKQYSNTLLLVVIAFLHSNSKASPRQFGV